MTASRIGVGLAARVVFAMTLSVLGVLGLAACGDGAPACGAPPCEALCEADTHRCGATCVADSRIDACGEACVVCEGRPHAVATCDGACGVVCENGYADCNGDLARADGDGCEVDLAAPTHCGACDRSCPPDQSLCSTMGAETLEHGCVSMCAGGQTQCGQRCVDTGSNVDHCGGCGIACDRAHAIGASCVQGACGYECAPGYADCVTIGADTDGCETLVGGSDVANCGACGKTCTAAPAHAAPICDGGTCDFACANGYMRSGAGCVMACQGIFLTNAPFAGGSGTAPDPYIICTRAQLEQVRNYATLDARFKLLADLDLAGTPFSPIGAPGTNDFRGYFDGGGRKIANLAFADAARDDVGLFTILTGSAVVANLTLKDLALTGRDRVGAVAGSGNGSAYQVIVSGTVNGRDDVGGIIGTSAYGSISDSTSSAVVVGRSRLGGVLGSGGASGARVVQSAASGAVTGTGNDVGGLAGIVAGSTGSTAPVFGCSASGPVSGADRVGGLIGSTLASAAAIHDSRASGTVNGVNAVGGLIGQNEILLIDAYATGPVSGTSLVGGLVGKNRGLVAHSYSSGAVTGSSATGGLVGGSDPGPYSAVAHSFWDTTTSGQSVSAGGSGKTTAELKSAGTFVTWDTYRRWTVGGGYPTFKASPTPCIVGAAGFSGGAGSVADPYVVTLPAQLYHVGCNSNAAFKLGADLDFATAPMTPQIGDPNNGTSFTGRFDGAGHSISNWVGYDVQAGLFSNLGSSAIVRDVRLSDVEVGGAYGVAAVVAYCMGTVTGVHATGVVRGYYVVGGLVGNASTGTTIARSSAAVDVYANDLAGGLVAYAGTTSSMTDCASTGAVTASSRAAGFASQGDGTISNCYSAGAVSSGAGFASTSGSVTSSYWDTEASGQAVSPRGAGLSTALMQSQASYVGWDFTSVWQISAGLYPSLR